MPKKTANKNRLIVACVVETGRSAQDVATQFKVSRQWVHILVARYRAGGWEAVQPQSKRPHSSPRSVEPQLRNRIVELRKSLDEQGLDAGAATISWHLERQGHRPPARSTIHQVLRAAGLITDQPRKRPRSSWRRFEASQPNETWQSDFIHWHLADGTGIEVINFLDDHSRALLSCTAHRAISGPIVVEQFLAACNQYGTPASTLTDNGLVYTTRLLRDGSINGFEKTLSSLGIRQKNGAGNHPQTQGKVERFHRTQEKWLDKHPTQGTLAELNQLLALFQQVYNEERPHTARGKMTPMEAYLALPKAHPAGNTQRTEYRLRMDKVDRFGKATVRYNGSLKHLGIGARHRGKIIIMLISDNELTVVEHGSGEILGEYDIDPAKDYQTKRKTPRSEDRGVNDLPRHL
ncbi:MULTISPECIES: IS481 family transposase [Micrococcaceae]|uniref:Mobile element protein n=1 Tax=Arthrobacter rhombi TaxID=71253 RepID=A0A1R4F8H8_9MICC|nr:MULTISPECIES: IS481 family transposase [Micrococcaceae]PCC26316.1 IS481 family transposase [Glutamicibacter sp. BW78]SJM52112.1 Mobile element protein [Arthrobacter rhombi]